MAAITNVIGQAAGTYYWSSASTWQGGVVPGHDGNADTDTVIINVPAAGIITIIIDQNLTIGNPASNTTFGVLVKGLSATNYVVLQVADGVSVEFTGLTAFGTNAGYPLKVERYARFEPQPGSTVIMDSATEMQNMAYIQGTVYAVGTAAKPITFTTKSSRINWGNSGTTSLTTSHEKAYWADKNIISVKLDHVWIANSAGNGVGNDESAGDTSINITAQAPAGLFTTRKIYQLDSNGLPDPTNLTTQGDYSINHDSGHIFINVGSTAYSAISATFTYKYMSFTGWGFRAQENTTYNEMIFDHCNFSYMGYYSSFLGAAYGGIAVRYKKSAAVEANRLFKLTNSTVKYSPSFLQIRSIVGSAADPILITGNTFYESGAPSNSYATIAVYIEANSYINISDNLFRSFCYSIKTAGGGTPIDQANWTISGNKVFANWFLDAQQYGAAPMSDLNMYNNIFHGAGATSQSASTAFIKNVYGTSGHPVLVHHNEFAHTYRNLIHESYIKIYNNKLINTYKHSNMFGASSLDLYITDVDFYNNVAWGHGITTSTSGWFQLGYNNRGWNDNVRVKNNTFYNAHNGIELQDLDIGTSGTNNITLIGTNIEVDNNIVHSMEQYAFQVGRGWNSQYNRARLHVTSLDNNIAYNSTLGAYLNLAPGTYYFGAERYNFAATRNVTGIALHSASYSTAQTGKSLVFTVTTPGADETLAWDGGPAVQIVKESGAFTSNGTNPVDGSTSRTPFGTVTDSSKTWQINDFRDVDINTVTSPSAMWIKITSGAGTGQIRMVSHTESATLLRVIPAWTTLPQTGDAYTIYKSMVQLTGGDAATVMVGIDLRSLPTASQTDTGISWASNSVTSDPLLTSPASLSTTVDDFKIQAGSPAIDAGTDLNAPTVDYFGTARTAAPDIGFYEYVAAGDPQTITFGALSATTYGAAPITLTATASSGLPVSYSSSNTAVATVDGSTVTIVGVGSTNITASQAGDGTWAAATPVVQALTVAKADQTISISAPRYKLPTDGPFTVTATASSGLACTLSIVSGPATILDGTVTLTGTLGDVVIRVVQAGNGNYNAAADTDKTVHVVDVIPAATTRSLSLSMSLSL